MDRSELLPQVTCLFLHSYFENHLFLVAPRILRIGRFLIPGPGWVLALYECIAHNDIEDYVSLTLLDHIHQMNLLHTTGIAWSLHETAMPHALDTVCRTTQLCLEKPTVSLLPWLRFLPFPSRPSISCAWTDNYKSIIYWALAMCQTLE